jgi:hypothetical protein
MNMCDVRFAVPRIAGEREKGKRHVEGLCMSVLGRNFFRTMPLRYFVLASIVGWTGIVGILFVVSRINERMQIEDRARTIARSLFQRDSRNTMLLNTIFITAGDGGSTTLYRDLLPKNSDSAVVTRHQSLLDAATSRDPSFVYLDYSIPIQSKIVSVDSSVHRYASDEWERGALGALTGTQMEYSEILQRNDEKLLRFAGALRDAPVCAHCHERKDFRAGTLRGAMSITIPLSPIWLSNANHRMIIQVILGSIWLVGLAGIIVMHRGMQQRIIERDKALDETRRVQSEQTKTELALEESVSELLQTEKRLHAEKLRTEIAGNLHDDIGTTLSSTSIFAELLDKELNGTSARASKLLSRIKYNLLTVQISLHDIVWAISPDNDSVETMLLKFRDYASDILDANGITFRCTF